MDVATAIGLFFAAVVGGALNSVAGGGSFIVYPTLLAVGVLPVPANATTTIALWPAGFASATAYRRELRTVRAMLFVLIVPSVVGGVLGSLLLTRTANATFERILPWLLAFATLLLTFGPRISALAGTADRRSSRGALVVTALVQLVISIYGGYFGGGMGVMMLAVLTLLGMTEIHEMNALKVVLGIAINGAAIVIFLLARLVAWGPAAIMVVGGIVGGFAGASIARQVDAARMRVVVLVLAWGVTIWFFVRALRPQ